MGERQLGPAVVEPGEPGVLLDLPSSSFFSYENYRKREGSLLNAAFLLYTQPFAMDDTIQRDKNLFLFQSFEGFFVINEIGYMTYKTSSRSVWEIVEFSLSTRTYTF